MKKRVLALLCACSLCLLVACAPQSAQQTSSPPPPESPVVSQTKTGDGAALFTPGTYAGTGVGAFGEIVLEVSFSEDKITDIKIDKHAETAAAGGAAMESLTATVLEHQTLAVDAVTAATATSMGYMRALKDAVAKAGGDEAAFSAAIPSPTYKDVEADIVVIGSGIAGLCAATEAQQLGLNVVLVEQSGIVGGSSSFAGFLVGADTQAQKKESLKDTHEQLVARLNTKDFLLDPGLFNQESIDYMVEESGKTIDWLIDVGANLWNVTRQDDITHFATTGVVGATIIPALEAELKATNVDCRLETRATEIIMDGDTAVGVKVSPRDGESYHIYAKSVVIATGGGYANKDFVVKCKPEFKDFVLSTGAKGADGSGIEMAGAVGAELAYMDQGSALPYMLIQRNRIPHVSPAGIIRARGGILVNLEGQRISNENAPYYHTSLAAVAQTDGRNFVIMDQDGFDLGGKDAEMTHLLENEYMPTADTLAELAEKVGIDPNGLVETVARYGEMARNGKDTDFNRPENYMRTDFTRGPYYCVEVNPCMHTTFGGISIDAKTHVLREDGSIIKGLYAAGECTVSHLQGIATNTFSAVFGRQAAQTALSDME